MTTRANSRPSRSADTRTSRPSRTNRPSRAAIGRTRGPGEPNPDPDRPAEAAPCRPEELASAHMKLVYALATRVYRAIRASVEFDDLVGFGTEGLLQAARRFDPTRGCTFATYAYPRIHGAIYDGIRQLAPLPTSFYRRSVGARRAGDGEQTPPAAFVGSLEVYLAQGHELVAADQDPEQTAIAHERRTLVARALERLPAPERDLLRARYYRGEDLDSSGRQLGVSRSWACRLHARALGHLRSSITAAGLAA